MTADQLFTYVPPTPERKTLHDAVNNACEEVFELATRDGTSFDDVNEVCKNYYVTIEKACPNSADKSAALRCVRLCRNGLNEFIKLGSGDAFRLALDNARMARWNANAAIALG